MVSPVPSVIPACPPSFRRALRHSRGSGNPRAVFQPSRAPGFMSERSVKSSCWIASCALNIRVPKRTVLTPPLRSCRVTTMPKGQRRVALHQAHHTTRTVAEALAEDKRHIPWQVALPGWGMRSIPTGRSHSSVSTARHRRPWDGQAQEGAQPLSRHARACGAKMREGGVVSPVRALSCSDSIETEALAVDLEDGQMMGRAIEQGRQRPTSRHEKSLGHRIVELNDNWQSLRILRSE